MIGKAVVKVTLNEATDPDLFAFVKQFDNERLRAGALRALARAALNGGDAKRVASGVLVEPVMSMTEPATPQPKTEVAGVVESRPTPIFSVDAAPATASQPPESRAAEPAITGTRRFNTDAIADQFADF
ncbi:hypothetical protein EVC45_39810 [Paraburkholderia sp. UYCP14C]|uniref:hypothetical protein n=1 Tax=Paraburkholderia sp. UYCP14C TaxID=2511130 RepID=UPI00102107B2|nr:hypothetical protein [Paraburkholderia sp. UYCP14C]RZF24229.1 hypothetical protein EVC45_39810 [Paraburkholderia sp. UYCP14C]